MIHLLCLLTSVAAMATPGQVAGTKAPKDQRPTRKTAQGKTTPRKMAPGHPNATVRLGLAEALRMAGRRNADVVAARAKIREANAAMKGARAAMFPTVSVFGLLQVQTKYQLDTLPDELKDSLATFFPDMDPDSLKMTVMERWNAIAGVSLIQPITSLYPLYKLFAIKRIDAQAGELELRSTRLNVNSKVVSAYLQVYQAKAYLAIARQAVRLMAAHEERVRKLLAGGAAKRSDLLQVQVKRAEIERLVIQAESGVKLARALLKFQLGMDPDRHIRLTENFPDPPPRFSLGLSECVRRAIKQRPELALIRARMTQADLGRQAAWFQYVPAVALFGGYQFSHGMESMFPTNRWFVGALATWSFEWGKKKFKVDEIEAKKARAEALYRKARQGIRLQVARFYFSLQAAEKSLQVSKKAMAKAREQRRMVERAYENQAATNTDVMGAHQALEKAQADHAAALYGYYQILAALKAAMGDAP